MQSIRPVLLAFWLLAFCGGVNADAAKADALQAIPAYSSYVVDQIDLLSSDQ